MEYCSGRFPLERTDRVRLASSLIGRIPVHELKTRKGLWSRRLILKEKRGVCAEAR